MQSTLHHFAQTTYTLLCLLSTIPCLYSQNLAKMVISRSPLPFSFTYIQSYYTILYYTKLIIQSFYTIWLQLPPLARETTVYVTNNLSATKHNSLKKPKQTKNPASSSLFFWQSGHDNSPETLPHQHSFIKLSYFSSDPSSLFSCSQCLLQPLNAGIIGCLGGSVC